MHEAWQILRDAGLPMAAPRSGAAMPPDVLARAARVAVAESPSGRDAEALAAWLFAWWHHWPGAFAAAFPDDASSILAWATRQLPDDNRYLKLRRIALANLASVL
jgi:hypothetical protein